MSETIETPPDLVDGAAKRAALLGQSAMPTREVALPAFGFDVTIRGLTRAEALRVVGKPLAADEAERKLIAMAMVDPVMTEDDVRRWQKVAPAGQLQPIETAIRELSGLTGDEVRTGVAGFSG